MGYLLTRRGDKIEIESDLKQHAFDTIAIHSRFLADNEAHEIVTAYRENRLEAHLNATTIHRFLAIIIDKNNGKVVIANDKFGSNHIFYAEREGVLYATDEARRLFDEWAEMPRINALAAYELLELYTICPPRTIYEGVLALPMGRLLVSEGGGVRVEQYWDFQGLLSAKKDDYEALLTSYRDAFMDSMRKDMTPETLDSLAIALSGGIDSGGMLAMLADISKRSVQSISVGAYGKSSRDLVSARATAQEHDSPHIEIYPVLADYARIPEMMSDLNQPFGIDVLFPNAIIFEEAQRRGLKKVGFGFGSEMLLGNLAMAKFSDKVHKIERFIPSFLRPLMYRMYARIKKLSYNQLDFLLAKKWSTRFLRVRGPLLMRDRVVYKVMPANFPAILESDFDPFLTQLPLGDAIVCMYLTSWENYLQWYGVGEYSRRYGIECIMPFNTPEVVKEMFAAPMRVRRMKDWDKLLIRDMFKPFISERLYDAVGRSLIIPYTKLFEPAKDDVIAYFRTSALIRELVDIDEYEKRYDTLPEPGLNLARIYGLAAWYDVNWNQQNLPNLERLTNKLVEKSIAA